MNPLYNRSAKTPALTATEESHGGDNLWPSTLTTYRSESDALEALQWGVVCRFPAPLCTEAGTGRRKKFHFKIRQSYTSGAATGNGEMQRFRWTRYWHLVYIIIIVRVWDRGKGGPHATWCACGAQRTIQWRWFSPSTFLWVPRTELKASEVMQLSVFGFFLFFSIFFFLTNWSYPLSLRLYLIFTYAILFLIHFLDTETFSPIRLSSDSP